MGAALTLAWPNPHVYVPTKSTAATTRPVLSMETGTCCVFRCSVCAEFTSPVAGVQFA